MKYKLESGKEKEFGKMTIKEKQEVEKNFIKGLLISGGILGGLGLLTKIY